MKLSTVEETRAALIKAGFTEDVLFDEPIVRFGTVRKLAEFLGLKP